MRPPTYSRCKRTIILPRTVPLCFSLLYMSFVSFLEQFIAGRSFYSKGNASAQNFVVQEDDKLAAYSTSLFSLLNMFFVSFLEQFIVGMLFYRKENASAQNFAVQKDNKFAAYSTSLFFPPVHILCVLFLTVFCREAHLQKRKCVRPEFRGSRRR